MVALSACGVMTEPLEMVEAKQPGYGWFLLEAMLVDADEVVGPPLVFGDAADAMLMLSLSRALTLRVAMTRMSMLSFRSEGPQ